MTIVNIKEVSKLIRQDKNFTHRSIIALTSGGFDPITPGHIACLRDTCSISDYLVVVVNGDGFLSRKKGKPFIPLRDRLLIVDAIKYVDYTVGFDPSKDGDMTICEALEIIRPHVFTKGGSDRSKPEEIPEWLICQELGINVKFGVGGFDKIASSSNYLNDWKKG